ncbi:UDP-N-acetylmuramate dehydrogenase [Patescibacteria group bacterium]
MKIKQGVRLDQFTTFKVGGPAEFFTEVNNKDDLIEAIKWAEQKNKKASILGGGSNVLVNSEGVRGLVIKINNQDISLVDEDNIMCGAGASLVSVFTFSTKQNLSGFEWAIGIPRATIGGSLRGNAEAFGVSMSDLVENVEVFDLDKKEFYYLDNSMCNFSYRDSIFKEKKNLLIWKVIFRLKKEKEVIVKDLVKQTLAHRGKNYPKFPNAGSVFQNSISFEEIKEKNPKLAEYMVRNGKISRLGNVASGFLIDYLDLKGKKIGGAQVSEKHANFIVNTGGATSDHIAMLIAYIKQQVRDKLHIQLKEEIQYFGF